MNKSKYHHTWELKKTKFTKDKGTVFSTFSCGGGSTMGYKLAGFDVIGCCEIDPKMMKAYRANHDPKYHYLESIADFKNRDDLPPELFDLDILDGSPPCSSFSMSGSREDAWGKKKKFAEGQTEQVLDQLFFDYIDLVKKLQPKVAVAENVKGMLVGNAFKYVQRIYEAFDEAGYYCQHWLLNAKDMGVPQRRERVFFVCLRKDLAEQFLYQKDMFEIAPRLNLDFNYDHINFSEVDDGFIEEFKPVYPCNIDYFDLCHPGKPISTVHPKGNFFNHFKANENDVCMTITASGVTYHHTQARCLTDREFCRVGTYPIDYDFGGLRNARYLIGMSVPPVMTANLADQIHEQWLSKIGLIEPLKMAPQDLDLIETRELYLKQIADAFSGKKGSS